MKKLAQRYYDRGKNPENTVKEPSAKEPIAKGPTAKEPTSTANELEATPIKYPYPKGVIFILLFTMFQSLSSFFIISILAIYLKKVLLFNENHATAIFHGFVTMGYFFPLFGAYISDSYLGKFRTLVYFSLIYLVGTYLLTLSSLPKMAHRILAFCGLFMRAVGGAGILPVIYTFGGEQFVLPEQAKQLSFFFGLYYMSVNISAFAGIFISPILRALSCFKMDSCYPLSFGLSSCFFTLALILIASGKRLYKIKKPEINVMFHVVKCISHAIAMRRKLKKTEKKDHWLDYASDKYDPQLITDTKILLSVALIFVPVPFFWALYEQQNTTWVFQAQRMNGSLGKWTILPEHMQIVNPILILTLIPFFEFVVFPVWNKLHILRTPLQKFGLGFILASAAFVISAIVAYFIQDEGKSNVHILWQIPQIFVITVSEILINVQALKFGYTQAPSSLKAVVSALWYLTIALGNVIITLVTGVSLFSKMMYELIFFAGLIFLDFFLFLFLAIRYKYHTDTN